MDKMKDAQCMMCGDNIKIHIYASAKKAICDGCKSQDTDIVEDLPTKDDLKGPRIDGKPNKALRKLCCPHHADTPMQVIGVIKGDWGDLISLQCRIKGCWTLVQISEQQAKMGHPLRTKCHGDGYEKDPDALIQHLEHGTLHRWKEENQE